MPIRTLRLKRSSSWCGPWRLGLEHAHRHGVVHRDIKPSNVLFGLDGNPRVTDFGLAVLTDRPIDARITDAHQILGSLLYMSPEQIEGPRDAIDKPTDVYALGILMFRLLTGSFPYREPRSTIGTDTQSSRRSARA